MTDGLKIDMTIVLKVGKKELTLTADEAKSLRDFLVRVFGSGNTWYYYGNPITTTETSPPYTVTWNSGIVNSNTTSGSDEFPTDNASDINPT